MFKRALVDRSSGGMRGGRGRGPSWLGVVLGAGLGAGCAQPGDSNTQSSAVGELTVSFQDGVGPSTGYAGTTDTYLAQNAPSTPAGSATTLKIDGDDPAGSTHDVVTLLRWDVSSIPAGSTVQSVTVTFNVTDGTTGTYNVYELKRDWNEGAATWNQAAAGTNWELPGAAGASDRGTSSLATVGTGTLGAYTATLNAAGVAAVQAWVNSPAANRGIVIASSTTTNGLDVSSSEATTAAQRPRLSITYLPPDAGSPTDAGSATDAASPTDAGTGMDSGGGSTSSTLVPVGASWKYRDTGENLGTAWSAPGYDDSGWAAGAAPLGYGGDGEVSTLNYGPNSAAKYITTYFRRAFTVADAAAVTALTMRLRRDDGAVVYLNGVEVARSNMPTGPVTAATLASSAVGGTDETTLFSSPLDRTKLVTGTNVLAVEIHQSGGSSSDLGFDLELTATSGSTGTDAGTGGSTANFAVVGDYGTDSSAEASVANLIKSWSPEFVVTLGDNNYSTGSATTIDTNIGKYYAEFIGNYTGSFGPGSATNRFFPSLGNHDWGTPGAQPYLDYFTLPGNERYYDYVRGPVHFFAIDSDTNEPDGTSSTSVQATWLQNRLAASTSPWKIVYFHHPPYSSGEHQSSTYMRWPFQAWGASIVLAGHEHSYERVSVGGYPYIVNGNGGQALRPFGALVAGSVYRNATDFGAQRVTATATSIRFDFVNPAGTVLDTLSLP